MRKVISALTIPRRGRTLLISGLLLIVVILMVAPFNASISESRIFNAVWDLGHVAGFVFICYGFYQFLPVLKSKKLCEQLVLVILSTLIFGLGIEGLQTLSSRTGSLNDLILDVVGAFIGVVLFSPHVSCLSDLSRRMLYSSVFVLLALSLLELASYLWDERRIAHEFPLLADFERQVEQSRWQGRTVKIISDEYASKGRQSLRVDFPAGQYAGIKLVSLNSDWTGYEFLLMDIFLPDVIQLDLTISIYDRNDTNTKYNYKNRFNEQLVLKKSWNRIKIPLQKIKSGPKTRLLSMNRIAGIMIYTMDLMNATTIYIDNVRLAR